MTIEQTASSSPPPLQKLDTSHKARTNRRKKRTTTTTTPTASIDRRKRPKNAPQVQSIPTSPLPSSPPSEFIRSLPVNSLIKYLDHHYLLNSPIRPNPTCPLSDPCKREVKQSIEEYYQFALLVSPDHDRPEADALSGSKHQYDISSTNNDLSTTKEADQSPSISPPTSIASSTSRSQFNLGTPSSAPFYEKLFSSSSQFLIAPDRDHQENDPGEKSKLHHPQENSLFKFDQTLLNLVLNHHHQSFPTLVIKPTDDSISHGKGSTTKNAVNHYDFLPSSPSSSHSSTAIGKSRINRKTATVHDPQEGDGTKPDDSPEKIAPTNRQSEKSKATTAKKANSMTLDQHGFAFKIHINEPPPPADNEVLNGPSNNPKFLSPDRRLEIIENHVLSNFVYSVKTRGNALRPKPSPSLFR